MKKLLVFGIDGVPFTLLRSYVRARPGGFFDSLLRDGHSRVLLSTLPYFTAPGWTTFMTGLDPDQHGIYHWRSRWDLRSGSRPLMSSRHLAQATFWWYCQQYGGRVSVSNFPMEYPAPPTHGRYICGTLAPEEAPSVTWPPTLIDEIRGAIPNYRFEMDKGLSYQDRPIQLRDHILEGGRNHGDAARRFGRPEASDLLVHVVTITDRVQHFFWHCMDHDHPQHATAPVDLVGNPIFDSYELAERLLEDLWTRGAWDNLLLVSDHGAGPSTIAFWTDVWLAERGYLSFREDGAVNVSASIAYGGEEPECAVYVNRMGTDGFGAVEADYGPLVARLRQELLQVTLPGTGARAFEAVHLGAELYGGRYADRGPDLVLEPADGVHPRPGRGASVFDAETRLYGGHRREGVFVAFGHDVQASPLEAGLKPLHLRDMFPMMCALMELPIPGGLSGTVPLDVLNDAAAPPVVDTAWNWAEQVESPPTPQVETEGMLHRLAELGYL